MHLPSYAMTEQIAHHRESVSLGMGLNRVHHIADPAIRIRDDVDFDDVTFLERISARKTMRNDVVDRRKEKSREKWRVMTDIRKSERGLQRCSRLRKLKPSNIFFAIVHQQGCSYLKIITIRP
ncbi:hypothetical protein ASD40_33590 [Paenibacillus sp. Root444D2]|nr:hypothetical protein ASD40_33590 [Paenibacillus sp. Root444D2]KRE41240.1 hypothetical protein ASG85_34255 [Paenibacillus sp. Soil724D2]